MADLFVEVHNIPAQGLDLQFREPVKRFPALAELTENGDIRFSGPLSASLRITPGKDLFFVEGQVAIDAEISCCRCLAPLQQSLAETFSLTYTADLPHGDGPDPAKDAPLELTAEDMGMALIRAGRIDLAAALQEAVIMALPMQPLCRKDCKGLCPNCGVDLNCEKCACAGPAPDPRLAALAQLKIPKRTS